MKVKEIKSDALKELELAISVSVIYSWGENEDNIKKSIIDSIFSSDTVWAVKKYLKEIKDKK